MCCFSDCQCIWVVRLSRSPVNSSVLTDIDFDVLFYYSVIQHPVRQERSKFGFLLSTLFFSAKGFPLFLTRAICTMQSLLVVCLLQETHHVPVAICSITLCCHLFMLQGPDISSKCHLINFLSAQLTGEMHVVLQALVL